jgi:hypothetical protein
LLGLAGLIAMLVRSFKRRERMTARGQILG